ncbi:MAG: hypothetical protein K0R54_2099 [Clostridiaceae bacterium]|jgi:hypothetical protein|nr:hypothetical protein [Clostridiaceae bacterium]
MDKYEEELLKKIDSGEKLTKSEIREVIEYEVESSYGDNRRWSRSVQTISKIGERFFSTVWDEGLTECQEDEYYDQPVEVQKKTYEKTITVTEWVLVNKESEAK